MGMTLNYIQDHAGGRKSFRRQLPNALKKVMGKTQIRVSLGWPDSPGFLSRYVLASAEFDREVATARRKLAGAFDVLDAPTVAYLSEAFHQAQLVIDDDGRWDPATHRLFKDAAADLPPRADAPRNPRPDNEAPPWATIIREALDFALPTYSAFRANGDIDSIVDHWRDGAIRFAEGQGLIVNPNDHAAIAILCRSMNDAGISSGKARLARLDGDDVPTPAEPEKPAKARTASKVPAVPIMTTFDAYAADRALTVRVRKEWRAAVQRLTEHVGHDDAQRLTAEDIRGWRNALLQVPSPKSGDLRSPVTVRNKYIRPVKAMLEWAVQEDKLEDNAARRVTVTVPRKPKLRESYFTKAEAKAILVATLQPITARLTDEHRLARRWVPWLCAYSGARVGEIAQLRAQDVAKVDGIWRYAITPEAGPVKTGEAREVPIHAHLIEQGFLDVVKAKGTGPLFYDPARVRKDHEGNRHIAKVGTRLAEWVREDVGITDKGIKPNHAWRHTFKTIGAEAGLGDRVMDDIEGHSPGSVGADYQRSTLKTMSDAMARFPRFEIVHTPVCLT